MAEYYRARLAEGHSKAEAHRLTMEHIAWVHDAPKRIAAAAEKTRAAREAKTKMILDPKYGDPLEPSTDIGHLNAKVDKVHKRLAYIEKLIEKNPLALKDDEALLGKDWKG